MKGWLSTNWRELATLEYGKAIRDYHDRTEGFPVFGTNGQIGFHSEALCPYPGVIVGRKGAYRGIHYSDRPFFVIDTAFYLKPEVTFDLRWAYYQLLNFDINRLDSGSAIPSTSRDAFYEIPVGLPPIATQRRIASILAAYDDLIQNNTRRIKILEEMAQMLYREWFVNFRFPGHVNVRMVESKLGSIPEGWEVVPLPDLCSKVIDGTHDSPPPVDDGYFLVTGKHFTSGFVNFDTCYRISPDEHEKVIKRSKPEPGDILFSNIGTLGSIALVPTRPIFSIKNVALFKPKAAAYSTFLYFYLRLPETLELLHKKASGTSQKFWSLQFLRTLPLIKPPEMLISLFHHHAEPLVSCRLLLHDKNTNLRATRDLLLPKLISGEISVEAAAELVGQTE